MRWMLCLLGCLWMVSGFAQKKTATVSGKIVDEDNKPVPNVSITVLGRQSGIVASDSGTFTIKIPAEKAVALIFSHTNYRQVQRNFYLANNEQEIINVKMYAGANTLQEVVVTDQRDRREAGLIRVNPKAAVLMPSTVGGVEGLIKTYVGSNNELTSQYTVRGGNFDENMVYINDFEVYRPYLTSSGQQEGLSLINPELTRNVNFFTGGFPARYGDKMSSVLDIQYKNPARFGGSAYVGLLEQGLALETASRNKKWQMLLGARNKNNNNVLSNQPVTGAYIPSANDAQAQITYRFSDKTQLEVLGIYSTSKFTFYPESVQKTAAVFSPFYAASLGLDVYFTGSEKDKYTTSLLGLSLIQQPSKALKLKWLASKFGDRETERYDIGADYLFGDRDFDNASPTFGQIINPLGAGYYQNYARNALKIDIWSLAHHGSYNMGKHVLLWGLGYDKNTIHDVLSQFEYRDSAGYSLPLGNANIYSAQHGVANLYFNKFSGYIQDNIDLRSKNTLMTLQPGVRINSSSLNGEVLISPRIQASINPGWKRDVLFKIAVGVYKQPPFYRELRKPDGSLNTNVKAQSSIQVVGGMDYKFIWLGERPFRLSVEGYYKKMNRVNVYDLDNVKLRYFANNNAKAYATGLELRLFGELVKDAESWISVGFMRTRENLDNDFYYNYLNAAGEIIGSGTKDRIVVDSNKVNVGWVRRPSDRLITFGMYLEDYLSTNKNFKVHLNLIYGTNMPFNVPNSAKYRNGFEIPAYIRADIGFSYLLLSEERIKRSHNPFKSFKSVWLSAEVFNLINRANTISYQIIKDFSNTSYAIPNRLTPRLLNLKLVTRF